MKLKLKRANRPAEHTGEIRFEDGTSVVVPCPTALREAYLETIPELPSHEEVQAYAEKHSHSNAPQTEEPLWARASALLGGFVLVGVGLFFIILGLPW